VTEICMYRCSCETSRGETADGWIRGKGLNWAPVAPYKVNWQDLVKHLGFSIEWDNV
jgi:hypothetical protein